MDRLHIVNKIHEIRSYIASDWPGVEERRALYETLRSLEVMLNEAEDKQKEDREA